MPTYAPRCVGLAVALAFALSPVLAAPPAVKTSFYKGKVVPLASLVEKIANIRQTAPEKPTKFQMSIPSQFEGVVMRLLAKRSDERFATVRDLVKELERVGRFSGAALD